MSRKEVEGPEVQRVSCTFCDELTARDHPESTQCHSFPSLPGLGGVHGTHWWMLDHYLCHGLSWPLFYLLQCSAVSLILSLCVLICLQYFPQAHFPQEHDICSSRGTQDHFRDT